MAVLSRKSISLLVHRALVFSLSLCTAICAFLPLAVRADQAHLFSFSIRSHNTTTGPQFVDASETETTERSVAIAACDSQTYWLSPSDAATLQAGVAAGYLIHLHVRIPGTPPENASALCVME